MHGNISMMHKQIFGVAKRALSVSSIYGVGHSSHSMHSMLPPSTPKARRLLRTAHRLSARSNSEPKGAVLAPKQAAVNLCGRPGYRAMLLLSEPTVAGINTKTPKQVRSMCPRPASPLVAPLLGMPEAEAYRPPFTGVLPYMRLGYWPPDRARVPAACCWVTPPASAAAA